MRSFKIPSISERSVSMLSLTVILLLAFLIRFLYLDKSLGVDEVISATFASKDISGLMSEVVRHDTHPPFYYLLLHVWIKMSRDEMWVRLPSVIFGTALTYVAYLLGKDAVGSKFGLAMGLLTAFSSRSVIISQLARNYACQALLANLSLLWLVRALRSHRASDWIKHSVASILAIYTFYYSILIVLLNNVTILLFHRYRRTLRPWVWSQVAILLCVAAWLPSFFQQVANVKRMATVDYQEKTFSTMIKDHLYIALGHLPGIDYRLILPPLPVVKVIWPIVLLILVLRFAIPFLRREDNAVGLCLVHTFGVFFLTLLLQGFNIIFVGINYFAYIIPWLFMLVLASIFGMGKKMRWTYAGIVVILISNAVGIVDLYAAPSEDFRAATAYIDRIADDDDLVCTVADFISNGYRFYSTRHLQVVGLPTGIPGVTPGMTMHDKKIPELLGRLFSGHKSIWMMFSHVRRGPVDRGKDRAREVLLQNGFQMDREMSKQFLGVEVEVFRAK